MSFAAYTSLSTHDAVVAPGQQQDIKRLPLHHAAMLVSALSLGLWAGIGATVYWVIG